MGTMEARTVKLGDMEMGCEILGQGEPLLLLHGMMGCSGDWVYAGRDELAKGYRLIMPDARGHGRSTNPAGAFSHRQCAADALALLSALGVERCKAIGMSLGGNTLLHMATLAPDRIEAMVIVSATMEFGPEARAVMRSVPLPEDQPESEWKSMRERHRLGDEQIAQIWKHARGLADSTDDVRFSEEDLGRVRARTLVVYGDRDPLYPVEMGVRLYRALPRASLWVVPGGGHGPVFVDAAPLFARTALAFLGSAA